MATKYCYNAKTGEIFEYHIDASGDTDFPRGTFLVDNRYLITGLIDIHDALGRAKEWGMCQTCDAVRRAREGKCAFCGNEVTIHDTVSIAGA